jgi:hypothetical protein
MVMAVEMLGEIYSNAAYDGPGRYIINAKIIHQVKAVIAREKEKDSI